MNKISFEDLLSEAFEEETVDDHYNHLSLVDATDHDIIMHREIHFGGDFDNMLKYYENDGVGIEEEFSIKHIKMLLQIEKDNKINLRTTLLTEDDYNDIKKYRDLYKNLYKIDETDNGGIAQLISNMILSEDEERTDEINGLVQAGEDAVEWLIKIIRTEDLYSPLSPGYGLSPLYATECLGKIGSSKAIQPIFENIERNADASIDALVRIGEPSANFLLKILERKHVDKDFEQAAVVLSNFTGNSNIAEKTFFAALKVNPNHDTSTLFYLSSCWETLPHKYHEQAKNILNNIKTDNNFYKHIQENIKLLLPA